MELHDKTVVVTGGAGFLGSYVVSALDELQARVAVPRSADYNLVLGGDVRAMYQRFKPDVVIHLAATVGGIGANRDNPGTFYYQNLMMGAQMIERARLSATHKFVAIGTVCSYPKYTPVPFKESHLWDGYPEETNAPYGIAKKCMLTQLQAYRQQFGFNGIFLIPVNLYGPGDNFDPNSSHVIPALIDKCVRARDAGAHSIMCWGTGMATREFLYAPDAAQAIVKATLEYDGPDPVNLGSGQEISIRELARLIADLTGFQGDIHWDDTKPDGQPWRKLDVSRARDRLGWQATTSLEDGLRRTIDWYETHRE